MNIPNTFGIAATADRYLEVGSEDELRQLLSSHQLHGTPLFVIGGGSNVVFTRHYEGCVLHMKNKGIHLIGEEDGSLLVEAAAGEVWDDFVHHCIAHGWHGAENLVAIPGTVGAAPVQNVGAYGVEAKDIIHSVRAFDIFTGDEHRLTAEECRFGYRDSIFKHDFKDRCVITSVVFRLRHDFCPNCEYKAVGEALVKAGVTTPSAQQLADIIAEVRWSKLPRPELTGSAGSFFKNPVVSAEQYEHLKAQHPGIVAFVVEGGYKLAAGWLIEQAGWKGRSLGRCGVYEKQALVLVNRGGCTGADVLALADAVTADVEQIFGVRLEKEAIIL